MAGLDYREGDLNQFPAKRNNTQPHVSAGDMHGNALKLIYVLIEEGFLELDEKRYNDLRDIYNTDVNSLTAEQLKTFKDIISSAKVNNDKSLTLIGDELADRGNNDYFTLLVLKKLSESHVDMEIMLSNHSVEFIRDYEKIRFTGAYKLGRGQGQSLKNLSSLIDKGLVEESEVRDIVERCYKPMVKAISYSMSEKGEVTLFSHTPIGLETIQSLARKFKVPYRDNTPKELFHTIDEINTHINVLFSNKELARLIDREGGTDPGRPVPPQTHPLHRLVWNREIDRELRTKTSNGMQVNFVHGHIGDGPTRSMDGEIAKTHQNLDTSWGKGPGLEQTLAEEDIHHYTRHSSDFTRSQLQFDALVKESQSEFAMWLTELGSQVKDLMDKGNPKHSEFNPKYAKVAKEAEDLYRTVHKAGKEFFGTLATVESVNRFDRTIKEAIAKANKEFSTHRSLWNGNNPFIKCIKGFLGVCSVLLAAIPAVVVHVTTKQGFKDTFFTTPATRSGEQLKSSSDRFKQVMSDMRGQSDLLKEVSSESSKRP